LLTIWRFECSHCIYFNCPFTGSQLRWEKNLKEKRKLVKAWKNYLGNWQIILNENF
jgi:hypothetical protein